MHTVFRSVRSIIGVQKPPIQNLPISLFPQRSTRRLSLDSSRTSSRNSSSSSSRSRTRSKKISFTRKSVELTICLSPELETSFQAGKFRTVERRNSTTSSLSEKFVDPPRKLPAVKMETAAEKVVHDDAVEPIVDMKPLCNLDIPPNQSEKFISPKNARSEERAKKRPPKKKPASPDPKTPSPKPKTNFRETTLRPSDGDYRKPDYHGRHSFDGVYIPNGQRTEAMYSQLDRRQSHEPNPSSNLESSLFSWSSTSLSPIQDPANSMFSNLPSTNPHARSPTPLQQDGFPDAPSSMRSNLATAVDSLPPSSFHSGATRVTTDDSEDPRFQSSFHSGATCVTTDDSEDPRFQSSFPVISASPPSVTPPPFNAAYVSSTGALTTPVASSYALTNNSFTPLEPSSMTFCATPSPSIVASNPSESSISNHLSGSLSSSTTSPCSSDNSLASSVLPLGVKKDYPDSSGPKNNNSINNHHINNHHNNSHHHNNNSHHHNNNSNHNNNSSKETNNNIQDLSPPKASKQESSKSIQGTPSNSGISSPIPSEINDSKSSLELFNIRLTDDVIVLKCSVCENYTVECRSLSDVTILTKVSNHIMEHVDLMN